MERQLRFSCERSSCAKRELTFRTQRLCRRGIVDSPPLPHIQPFPFALNRHFFLTMANIKAETQLNFTTRNTYNDITNILERNNSNDGNNNLGGPVEENMLPKDDTKRLLIVKPVDDTMLPNPFREEQNKHPQIKFHHRQEYIEGAATVSEQVANKSMRVSSTFATLGAKKHNKQKDAFRTSKGKSELRVVSRPHKEVRRRRVGRRQVRQSNIKRKKAKKATTYC